MSFVLHLEIASHFTLLVSTHFSDVNTFVLLLPLAFENLKTTNYILLENHNNSK